MLPRHKCPHCGYDNLSHAAICFQCGNPLTGPARAGRGPARRSHRILSLMQGATSSSRLRAGAQGDTGTLGVINLEQPITCLRCGTMNSPNAPYCATCATPLILPHEPTRLVIRASARSNVGRVRENNEDSVALWCIKGAVIALVADGMGGAVAGEEASRLVVEAVQADFTGEQRGCDELLTLDESGIRARLTAAIESGNMAVIDRVKQNPSLRGMGTTATLLFARGNRALVAHVGDSRAYLIDGTQHWIAQITSDHSFVEALVGAGHITEEQAMHHPMKNVLYRALGQTPDTQIDLYDRRLNPGDRIVMCSDGLTRHATPQEIARLVLVDGDPAAASQRLVDLANERGGEDNLTVIVLSVELMPDVPQVPTVRGDSLPTPAPEGWIPAGPGDDARVTMVPAGPESEKDDTLVEPQSDDVLTAPLDDDDTLITRRKAARTTTQEIPALTVDDEEGPTIPARPGPLNPER